MGSLGSVIATCLFLYIIYNSYTEEVESEKEVKNNPWLITSFFVDTNETEEATPCATTLEFSAISPTPTHVYNILPILTADELQNYPQISSSSSSSSNNLSNTFSSRNPSSSSKE